MLFFQQACAYRQVFIQLKVACSSLHHSNTIFHGIPYLKQLFDRQVQHEASHKPSSPGASSFTDMSLLTEWAREGCCSDLLT